MKITPKQKQILQAVCETSLDVDKAADLIDVSPFKINKVIGDVLHKHRIDSLSKLVSVALKLKLVQPSRLTSGQTKVVQAMCDFSCNLDDVAKELGLAKRTVETTLQHARKRNDIKSTIELIDFAIKHKLITRKL